MTWDVDAFELREEAKTVVREASNWSGAPPSVLDAALHLEGLIEAFLNENHRVVTDAAQHERVAEFVKGLNRLCNRTGLMVVGTTSGQTALRLMPKGGGVTIDAVHWHGAEYVDGAEYRRRQDPKWAQATWGDGKRRAGNERLPGEGPKMGDGAETLREKATRGTVPVPLYATSTCAGEHEWEDRSAGYEGSEVQTRCKRCGWLKITDGGAQ